jgi:hypothetical protein
MFDYFLIIDSMVSLLTQLAVFVYGLIEQVFVQDQLLTQIVLDEIEDGVDDVISDAEENRNIVTETIQQTSQAVIEADQATTDAAVAEIGLVVALSTAATKEAVKAVGEGLSDEIDSVDASVAGLESTVEAGIGGLGDILSGVLGVLEDGLAVTVNNEIIIDDSIYGEITDAFQSTLVASQEENAAILGSITDVFTDVVSDLSRDLIGELAQESPELARIASAILTNTGIEGDVLGSVMNPGPEGFGGNLVTSIMSSLAEDQPVQPDDFSKTFPNPLEDEALWNCEEIRSLGELIGDANLHGIWFKFVHGIAKALSLIRIPLAYAAVATEASVYRYRSCHPTQPLPPGDSIAAWQRGIISGTRLDLNLRMQGYSSKTAKQMTEVGFTIPDLGILYSAYLRGLIDDGDFDASLKALGYAGEYREPIKELRFFIPPVQDLITMAVREVFTPEIAEAQQQFEDFPPEFARWAAQQGVSEEWARNYWAAHWSLPSPQAGYEMLHRGIIDEEQLSTLLRALDVMPGWRDPMIAISYRPYTRVDIRRMHRVGVLNEAEVNQAYRDIGYDAFKAEKLTEFTVELNQEDDLLTLDVASDLTRSSIIGFYTDGIISQTTASALLLQAGINVGAAALYLMSADFDIERQQRKDQINIVLDRFKYGGLSYTEAADEIRQLGLQPRESELALLDLTRIREQETKTPSKADLDKFLKAGIIEAEEYVDQLERMGYSPMWSSRYLALQQGETN